MKKTAQHYTDSERTSTSEKENIFSYPRLSANCVSNSNFSESLDTTDAEVSFSTFIFSPQLPSPQLLILIEKKFI